MHNNVFKLFWFIVGLAAAASAYYFEMPLIYLVTAFAAYRFHIITIIECVVAGSYEAILAYEQLGIEEATGEFDEYEEKEDRAALTSETFTRRLNSINDWDSGS